MTASRARLLFWSERQGRGWTARAPGRRWPHPRHSRATRRPGAHRISGSGTEGRPPRPCRPPRCCPLGTPGPPAGECPSVAQEAPLPASAAGPLPGRPLPPPRLLSELAAAAPGLWWAFADLRGACVPGNRGLSFGRREALAGTGLVTCWPASPRRGVGRALSTLSAGPAPRWRRGPSPRSPGGRTPRNTIAARPPGPGQPRVGHGVSSLESRSPGWALTGPGQPRGPSLAQPSQWLPAAEVRGRMDARLWPGGLAPSWPESTWLGSLQDTPQHPRPLPKGTGLRRRYQEWLAEPPGLRVGTPRPLPPPLLSSGAGRPGAEAGPAEGRAVGGLGGLPSGTGRPPPGAWPGTSPGHLLDPGVPGASVITPSAQGPGAGSRPTQHRPLARPRRRLATPSARGQRSKAPSGGLRPGGTSPPGVSMRRSPLHTRPAPSAPTPTTPPRPARTAGHPRCRGARHPRCRGRDEPFVAFVPLSPSLPSTYLLRVGLGASVMCETGWHRRVPGQPRGPEGGQTGRPS